MKIYLIAGEPSGDMHASNLIKALVQKDASLDLRGIAGHKSEKEGLTLFQHYSAIAFMGVWEVIKNLPTIFKSIKATQKDILSFKPDAIILVDFSGYNMRMAKFAKANGIKTLYYISPKIWAWNTSRVKKVIACVDKMYCILPFEVDFYAEHGYNKAEYVGNPLMDEIEAFKPNENFNASHHFGSKPLIALLPGSRRQEILKILPTLAAVPARMPQYQFAVACTEDFPEVFYTQFFSEGHNIKLIKSDTYNLLHHSKGAVVTSGTATLETALLNIPQVVVYKSSAFTVAAIRMVIKIKFISLVNLIATCGIVKELIQDECTAESIEAELDKILNNAENNALLLTEYAILQKNVGRAGASNRTADKILAYLKN